MKKVQKNEKKKKIRKQYETKRSKNIMVYDLTIFAYKLLILATLLY